MQTGIKRFIIIEEISKKHPHILEKLNLKKKKPSVILDSIDDFRERLLTPEEASVKLVRWVTMQIAHAELYELYDQHLTDNALVDYPRMIQFAVQAFAADADLTVHMSVSSLIFWLMSHKTSISLRNLC